MEQGDLFGPTLSELRAEVAKHLVPGMPGMTCRVCDQLVKLTKRKLHSAMAYALVRLYLWDLKHPGQFMDYRDWKVGPTSRNHPYMRFWNLIEPGDQRGFFRIVGPGRAFVQDRTMKVPRCIWHFNDRCWGFTDSETTLTRALGDKFDLDELLASAVE